MILSLPIFALCGAAVVASQAARSVARGLLRAAIVLELVLLVGWAGAGGTDCGVDCSAANDVFAYLSLYFGPALLLILVLATLRPRRADEGADRR